MNSINQQKIKRRIFREALQHHKIVREDLNIYLKNLREAKGNQHTRQDTELISSGAHIAERPGALISAQNILPPFTNGSSLERTFAKLGDENSVFSAILSDTDLNTGELNLATSMGKWFPFNYNPRGEHMPDPDSLLPIFNTTCSYFGKPINFAPFFRDVWAIARVTGTLPVTDFFMYIDWSPSTPSIIHQAGVQADFNVSLSYINPDDSITSSGAQKRIVRAVRTDDQFDEEPYLPVIHHECMLKLPAGTSEIAFGTYLIGYAFTSNDVNKCLADGRDYEYAIAMMDLRNKINNRNMPTFVNPLTGVFFRPPGGLRLQVELEFREVQSPGTE